VPGFAFERPLELIVDSFQFAHNWYPNNSTMGPGQWFLVSGF